jgi:hypothetical protein
VLCIGGGGHGHSLELDSSLCSGFSFCSATFGNIPLAGDEPRFEIERVEAWGLGADAAARSTEIRAEGCGGLVGRLSPDAVSLRGLQRRRAIQAEARAKFIAGTTNTLWL